MVRLFDETRQLCDASGVRPETVLGLAGLGDIILHCTTPRARAWQVGYLIGRSTGLDPQLTTRPTTTAEALATLEVTRAWAEHLALPVPAIRAVCEGAMGDGLGRAALTKVVIAETHPPAPRAPTTTPQQG
jgi:glycerol-3-phosphate dehydrogenase (NAD(P)+)